MISPFNAFLALFYHPASQPAIDVFIHEDPPRLLELYDDLLLESRDERGDDLLGILKTFTLYDFDGRSSESNRCDPR